MSLSGNVTLVAPDRNILETAADTLIARCDHADDLANTVVLLPDLQFAAQLRMRLVEAAETRGFDALLGPAITTPDLWLAENTWLEQDTPGRARRELLLVEVLQQHPDVYNHSDPWHVAAGLATLFEELTLHRVPLPETVEAFIQRLRSAYGIEDSLPLPLTREGDIVYRLWNAWHTQLQADNMLDPGAARLQRLALAGEAGQDRQFLLVGFDDLSVADAEWFRSLLENGKAHGIFYRGNTHPGPLADLLTDTGKESLPASTPAGEVLDAVFMPADRPMAERAAAMAERYAASPLAQQLTVFTARSPEAEARAIDLTVRRWLLDGRQAIGIVAEDRRLARRVRALLERAGITPRDMGGWALSTTSAAAALERWLETVEEDFAHQPLLDILKSPFSFPDDDPGNYSACVYRFEQDIVLHEQIARGLERYRRHIRSRQERLRQLWSEQTASQLQELLNRLDHAAEPLRPFLDSHAHEPVLLLEALRQSLGELGIWQAFGNDPAGMRIINEWQLLHLAASESRVRMTWPEFRAWLGSALERHDFTPATGDSPVVLLTLAQAQVGKFDGLVIGACDLEYLPSRTPPSPFFNDAVRLDLGLPVWPDQYALQLMRFRRLLERAPDVLMTWHCEVNGEQRMQAPWVAALLNFQQLAWGSDLENSELQHLLDDPDSQVLGSNPLPATAFEGRPAPVLPPGRLPEKVSVSAHDDLIACPYRFFAARGLGLKPSETISEALEKSDYGELVHLSLEVFHAGREGYPPAFGKTVTENTRADAISCLEKISNSVFDRQLEDNFEHRTWKRRWLEHVPGYIDWQIGRAQHWQFAHAEQTLEVTLDNGRIVNGRIDRLDRDGERMAVIDYKTGGIPKQDEVDAGERVQLSSYALLTEQLPERVDYLYLDDNSNKVKTTATLESGQLAGLTTAVRQRLVDVLDAIEAGSPMPAWGDEAACQYCSMDAVCRQQAWSEETGKPDD